MVRLGALVNLKIWKSEIMALQQAIPTRQSTCCPQASSKVVLHMEDLHKLPAVEFINSFIICLKLYNKCISAAYKDICYHLEKRK